MQMMPIDQIIPDNPYLRLNTDVHELVMSIKSVGLIHPLTVNNKNVLLAGGRRFHACRLLGMTEVPVVIVEKDEMEQELISIDENIVRKPLDKMEFEKCLNRGREIYEILNPEVIKVLEEEDAPSKKVGRVPPEEEENVDDEKRSYASLTAEKTGLSANVIRSAIKRDALASSKVKQARLDGEISASQVNEIIKLQESEQEDILPFVKEKTVKEIRTIVDDAKTVGLMEAIRKDREKVVLPKELKELLKTANKLKKIISKAVIEEMVSNAPEMSKLLLELENVRDLINKFDKMNNSDFPKIHESETSFENDQVETPLANLTNRGHSTLSQGEVQTH